MKSPMRRIILSALAGAAIVTLACSAKAAYSPIANGRAIFQTGKDLNGVQIKANPPALMPHCAACHGANGAGGKKLPGGAVSADLRHAALVTHQKHPYTLALLERAISTGVDNDGKHLNPVMPHWQLSKRDLHDVAYYVLTQLK
jgi:mono/diheme cytochrome c family protein